MILDPTVRTTLNRTGVIIALFQGVGNRCEGWQVKAEGATRAHLALDPNVAPVGVDDSFTQVQPQPGAGHAGARLVRAVKLLEKVT